MRVPLSDAEVYLQGVVLGAVLPQLVAQPLVLQRQLPHLGEVGSLAQTISTRHAGHWCPKKYASWDD